MTLSVSIRAGMIMTLLVLSTAFVLAYTEAPDADPIVLSYAPADTSIALGDSGSLCICLDDSIDVRTIEVWVEYDPAIVVSVDGEPGQLFWDTSAYIFEDFEEDSLGYWHGYAIVVGGDYWAMGPGELYVWYFDTAQIGTTDVTTVDVHLYDRYAVRYEDVSLPPTSITVGQPAGIPAPDIAGLLPAIELAPNPFNPRTELTFSVPEPGHGRISVFDCRGRRVMTVWEGWADAGLQKVIWAGCDEYGQPLSSGVYFFRLEGLSEGTKLTRGILLR